MTFTEVPMPELAIVGMAGRFPDADNIAELWQLLLDGREAVRQFELEELRAAGVPELHLSNPAYMPYGTTVSAADTFDAAYFGMSPAEAATTDPQHRLFMECALRALEDAGVPSGGQIGVFASTGYPDYLMRNIWASGMHTGPDLPYSVRLGNQIDFLASRLCHVLDLRGPGVGIQTSCSSSLVGVDAACTSLIMRRCDVAVVGAAILRIPHPSGYLLAEGGFWSRDGHCRPFDAAASGFVPGNGAAVMVLKRLTDAIADRDRIYASIRGIGINNDGADKISYTAPSTSGQIAAITQGLTYSGIAASDIGYIEAHGSGTVLGDPIEADALAKAYASAGGVAPGCGLGSLKANIGHMSPACGIAGLVKTALILRHQIIPPQINYSEPNPLLKIDQHGFTIYQRSHSPDAGLRAAAVSSLGVGGTNAHIVLSAPPQISNGNRPVPAERPYELMLSARSTEDLKVIAEELYGHITAHKVRIDDLAYTLTCRRTPSRVTAVLQARTIAEARQELQRFLEGPTIFTEAISTHDMGELPNAVKIPLPGYPLRPTRHWVSPPSLGYGISHEPQATSITERSVGDLLEQVVNIFRIHLGVEQLGPDDDFDNAGGTSLKAIEIVDAITDQLGPAISLSKFIQLRTPRRITEEIRTWPGGNLVDPVIIKLRDGTPGEEIFFIHPANGSVFCYQKLAMHTDFPRPVYAISYPFEDPNPPETIPEMAARYISEITAVAPDGPYRIAGYSLGGNIAIEMAHQLQQAGEDVADVIMIDALPLDAYPRDVVETDWLRTAPIAVSYLLDLPVPTTRAETMEDVLALLRQPTWSHRTEETMRRFVAMFVRTGKALSAAIQPPPVRADLTILCATERANPVFEALRIQDLPPETWRHQTTGNMTVIPVPGNHYTLYSDPENFTNLAAALDLICRR
jgi:phthiocerol/phenolphthiocerol synthesis type-I polyketide synthase E